MFLCVYDMQPSHISVQNPSEGGVTVTLECLLLSVWELGLQEDQAEPPVSLSWREESCL